MLKKVSVIVPIYNSAATLSRCVESILSQDYENLEVILVNDSSLDSSLEICEKFKEKDSRVIVINKENFGVSAARNSGLSIASGEFIQFVDADDYINLDMTRCLVDSIEKSSADFVICGYNRVSNGEFIKKSPSNFYSNNLITFKDCFERLYNGAFFNAPWNKLYRRDKIKTLFDESLFIGEDLLFNLSYASNCDKIVVISDALYNYDVSLQNGLASQYDENLFCTEIMLHKKVQKFFKTSFNSDDFRNINETFAKEIYYYLKKLVISSNENKDMKLEKIRTCFEDEFVKNMLCKVNFTDSQVKILCLLMKLRFDRAIYLFFKLKSLINRNAMH